MRDETALLLDILMAARSIKAFMHEVSEEEFLQNRYHQSAVIREIIVIGEAARQLSEDFRNAHPTLPWRKIIGMRNYLIHQYFSIDLGIVWEVVTTDLEQLIAYLEPLVPPNDQASPNDNGAV